MAYNEYQGATTVGIICKNGVILASDKRVTYGYMMTSKSGLKVFKLSESIGLAYAGLMSDMQAMTREAIAYSKLYELENNRPITVKAMAKLISNLLFNRQMMPLLMETLVGGVDDSGPELYSMDPVGSLIPDPYIAAGSGAPIAVGILEAEYKEDLSLENGADLAVKAIKSAIARDIMSGGSIDMLLISKSGTEERFIPLK